MKKVLLVLLSVLITSFVFAQDIIVTKEGKRIESKILEVNEYDIKYKNFENIDGPIYTMRKSEIATILYANGQVDVFNMNMNTAPTWQPTPNTIFYTKADFDNAKKLRNAGISCFAGGLGLCIIGSVVASTSYYYYGWGSWYYNSTQAAVGSALATIGSLTTIAGIVMWPVGQSKMNRIRRMNPNGFSLFENEKVQLNLAIDGNNAKIKFNF